MMVFERAPAGCSLALPSSWQRPRGTIPAWIATSVCLNVSSQRSRVPLVLFPRPNHHQVATLATLQDRLLSPPWRPRPILLSHTDGGPRTRIKSRGPRGTGYTYGETGGPETARGSYLPRPSHPWVSLRMGVKEGWGSQMPGSHLGMWAPKHGCLCTHKSQDNS